MAKPMDKTRLSNTGIANKHYFKYSLWRGGFTNGGRTRFTHVLLLMNEKADSINKAFVSKITLEKIISRRTQSLLLRRRSTTDGKGSRLEERWSAWQNVIKFVAFHNEVIKGEILFN